MPVYKQDFDAAVSILIPLYNRKNDLFLLGKKGDFTIHQIGIGTNQLHFFSKYEGTTMIFSFSQIENVNIFY